MRNKDGDRAVDLHLCFRYIDSTYEGDSSINDNGFISQKVLLDSVLFIMPHEDPDITYFWCIYYGWIRNYDNLNMTLVVLMAAKISISIHFCYVGRVIK